jgi:serine/threonine protein kinase
VGAVAGEGGFCQVRLAVHHLSRRRVAVKVIDKTKLSDAAEARRMQVCDCVGPPSAPCGRQLKGSHSMCLLHALCSLYVS